MSIEEGKGLEYVIGDELDNEILERVPKEYFSKPPVLGRSDVLAGAEVLVPTTVYEVTGDDASGVAGILFPTRAFTEASPEKLTAKYWESDETLKYEVTVDADLNDPSKPVVRVIGNSWARGEVVWNGTVAGSINQRGLDGDEDDGERNIVKRRFKDASILGDWPTKGDTLLMRPARRGMEKEPLRRVA